MKAKLLFFILALVTFNAYSQDTLARFFYNNISEDAKIFVKQTGKNQCSIFGITEDSFKELIVDVEKNKQIYFEEEFDNKTKQARNIYFTDTSLIILKTNKVKNQNTYKYEYLFTKQIAIKSSLNIEQFNDSKVIAQVVVKNEMQFLKLSKDSVIFIKIDSNFNVKKYYYDINDMSKISSLKVSTIKKYFVPDDMLISYVGDYNIINLASSKKCYINTNNAYLMNSGMSENKMGIFNFNFEANKITYLCFAKDETVCKSKHLIQDHFYSFTMTNNCIAMARNCNQNIKINFYNPNTGELQRSYSVDSAHNNPLKNIFVQKSTLNESEVMELTNYRKVFGMPFGYTNDYIACIPINENEFALSTGFYKERRSAFSVLMSLTSLGFSFASLMNPIVVSSANFLTTTTTELYTRYIAYELGANILSNRFYVTNKDRVARAKYVTTFFTNNLEEVVLDKPKFNNTLNTSKTAINFMFNGKPYSYVCDIDKTTENSYFVSVF